MSTWTPLLELPFAERIFLDDHSPDFNALHLLKTIGLTARFDQVQYTPAPHAPHSNFGIIRSLGLARTELIMHLDDDVSIDTSTGGFVDLIYRAVDTLAADPTILGVNLLNINPSVQGADWMPTEPYAGRAGLYHPAVYFGTAACVMRRTLLDRVGLDQILAWGAQQPDVWEKIISHSPKEFLTGEIKTPFSVPDNSYFFNAAHKLSKKGEWAYLGKKKAQRILSFMGVRRGK